MMMIPLLPPTQGRRANCHHYLLYFLLHDGATYIICMAIFPVPCALRSNSIKVPRILTNFCRRVIQTIKPSHNNHTCYSSVAPLQHAALQQDSPIRNRFLPPPPSPPIVSSRRPFPSDLIPTTLLRQLESITTDKTIILIVERHLISPPETPVFTSNRRNMSLLRPERLREHSGLHVSERACRSAEARVRHRNQPLGKTDLIWRSRGSIAGSRQKPWQQLPRRREEWRVR